MPRSENVGPRLAIWEGDGLIVVVSGVGKVAAAMATQYACDVFKPRAAVAIGLAGALEDGVRPGQVIVASGAMQHDYTISSDPAATEKMLTSARLESRDARPGLVLTGDQIVTSRAVRDALQRDFPDAACIDTETAALAQVAQQNGVPWTALRVISESADESFDLRRVMGLGVSTAAKLFESIIQTVAGDL